MRYEGHRHIFMFPRLPSPATQPSVTRDQAAAPLTAVPGTPPATAAPGNTAGQPPSTGEPAGRRKRASLTPKAGHAVQRDAQIIGSLPI